MSGMDGGVAESAASSRTAPGAKSRESLTHQIDDDVPCERREKDRTKPSRSVSAEKEG